MLATLESSLATGTRSKRIADGTAAAGGYALIFLDFQSRLLLEALAAFCHRGFASTTGNYNP